MDNHMNMICNNDIKGDDQKINLGRNRILMNS